MMSKEHFAVDIKMSGFSDNAPNMVQSALDHLCERIPDITEDTTIVLVDEMNGFCIGEAKIQFRAGQKQDG